MGKMSKYWSELPPSIIVRHRFLFDVFYNLSPPWPCRCLLLKSIKELTLPFSALHKCLQKAITHLKFEALTPVQQAVLPLAEKGQDLMVGAKTGSGKTGAYLIPITQKLLTTTARHTSTRALILSPTRELAQQIVKNTQQFINFSNLSVELITGGASLKEQAALFRKNPDFIVATPGRLIDHIKRGTPDFKHLEYLVLDEADRMLDMGFREDVISIIEQTSIQRQTLLFSATLEHQGIHKIAKEHLNAPEFISVDAANSSLSHIQQQVILVDDTHHKIKLVEALLANETFRKAIVFTNTRQFASDLMNHLQTRDNTGILHSELSQDERKFVMNGFTQKSLDVLIATDVAARGIDIEGIDLVINADLARSSNEHIHRVGRTGRAGSEGKAISLISAADWNLMVKIENYLQTKFERTKVPGLVGHYKGPKKLKSSGKAAGSKKKKAKKTIGKNTSQTTRKPRTTKTSDSKKTNVSNKDGFSPPKRKPKN